MDSPARILLADDEEPFLSSSADLLRQEGYVVDSAVDGINAALNLRENPYDLLIADIRMCGNSDLELIQGLPETNQGLPVILMTGHPSIQTAIQAVNLSVLAYLVKPMVFQDLQVQVRRGVAQRRIQVTITESARRIQDWAGEMAQLTTRFRQSSGGTSVQQMLGGMLGRMGETLLDMKHLVDLSDGLEVDGKSCSVHNCPQLEAYHRIFSEGIKILERTKEAFKSRNLEDLRHRMETAIGNHAG